MNMTADSTEFAGTAVAGDDLDLVHAIQSGDVSAFDQLVGRYDLKLLRIAQNRHPGDKELSFLNDTRLRSACARMPHAPSYLKHRATAEVQRSANF